MEINSLSLVYAQLMIKYTQQSREKGVGKIFFFDKILLHNFFFYFLKPRATHHKFSFISPLSFFFVGVMPFICVAVSILCAGKPPI
jgi:hypothetical protein